MKKLIIVDVSNFIFRAFYAIRLLNAPDGTPVNAVHGVLSMMLKLLSTYRPTHLFIARDTGKGTFRKEMYEQYKANRSEPPDELKPQFALVEKLMNKLDIATLAMNNYEADDVIGSAVTQWEDEFDEIYIATGDKDLMQFVNDKVKVLDTMKNIIYDRDKVFEKMGVWPDQIVDYLSMVGDSSDNIPGMKGIGAKGASKLLGEFKTFERCIAHKNEFKGKKLINAFENYLDEGLLSKKLIQIKTDLDLGVTGSQTQYLFQPGALLYDFLHELGFKSTVKKIKDIADNSEQAEIRETQEQFQGPQTQESHLFESQVVGDMKFFSEIIKTIKKCDILSVITEYDSRDIYERNIVSISLSMDGKKVYFFPFKNQKSVLQLDGDNNLPEGSLEQLLVILWEEDNKIIFSPHSKRDYSFYAKNGRKIKSKIFDLIQAHYVLDPSKNHKYDKILEEYFGESCIAADLSPVDFVKLDLLNAVNYTTSRSGYAYFLGKKLKEKLEKNKLINVYDEMDGPLLEILSLMEKEGVFLNVGFLKKLNIEFSEKLALIEKDVCINADIEEMTVNLKSPKQVGDLLFNKLNFPALKKTKTGFSTDSEVLEELASHSDSKIPDLILQYRETEKLLSTYVKTLPELVNSISGRIHTSFNLHTAVTGRLTSLNPNLQNIPVRSENGRLIRKAFTATPGKLFLSADYSQVELRILAHFSNDPIMVKSFQNDEDIHAQTASEVLGISLDQVTKDQRSKAKAVNFGLMYGQSSFGLAKSLRISRNEAKEYITKYFSRFSKVKVYIDSLKEFCEEHGYSVTYHGRKRFLPDIYSTNRNIKAMAERVAVNSPIQGTAADIIKLAMIDINSQLNRLNLKTKMLLQVHDELIFEVDENEIDQIKSLVKNSMESVVTLNIPLKVDIGIGINWYDLK